MPSAQTFIKDPADVLDYTVHFAGSTTLSEQTDWLAAGETVLTNTVTVPTGITLDSKSITDSSTSITAWISGGTAGEEYEIGYKAVTSDARTIERSIVIFVKDL